MNQLNLLNNTQKERIESTSIMNGVVTFLGFVFVLAILAYGGMYFFTLKTNQDIKKIKDEIVIKQNSQEIKTDRQNVLTRQGQLREVNRLMSSRGDYAGLIPELALTTLRGIVYQSVGVSKDGKIRLSLLVKDYGELDRFLTVFSTPEMSGVFKSPKVVSVGKSNEVPGFSVSSVVEIVYDKEALAKNPKRIVPSVKGVTTEEGDYINYQISE